MDYFIVRSRLALKKHQSDGAVSEARRALDLSSNDAEAMEVLAEALIFSGQSNGGIEYAQRAMRQNPTQPGRPLYLMGLAEFSLGNTSASINYLSRAIKHTPNDASILGVLAAAYGELGQIEKAKSVFEEYNRVAVGEHWVLHEIMTQFPFSTATVLNRFAAGLRMAGAPVRSGEFLPLHMANKLSGREIKSLLFGKQIEGTRFWNMDDRWRQQRMATGTVEHTGHAIQPGVNSGDSGVGKIEEDMLCEIWPKLAKDIELCFVVFLITDRVARIRWGDYVMVTDSGPHPFSVAD